MTSADPKFDHKFMLKNILSIYDNVDPDLMDSGLNWYEQAREECAKIAHRHNISLPKVIGVVAAISPRINWEYNIYTARVIIYNWVKRERDGTEILKPEDLPKIMVTHVNRTKALLILRGKPVLKVLVGAGTGWKTSEFYRCILNPTNETSVCVDTHAYRQATQDTARVKKINITEQRYNLISDAFREAAHQRNVRPLQMQAACWIHRTGKAALYQQQDLWKIEDTL
jgi:hypothetical protein